MIEQTQIPVQEGAARRARETSWAFHRSEVGRRIENAALTLFEQHGLEAVTVDQIAAASGVSRRTFYRYFDSPGSVVASMPRRLLERWAEVMRASPPDEAILTSLLMATQRCPPEPVEMAVMDAALAVMRRSPDAWARASGELAAHTRQKFQEVIAERMQARGDNPRAAGVIAAGLAAMIAQIAEESPQDTALIDSNWLRTALRDLGAMLSHAGLLGPQDGG